MLAKTNGIKRLKREKIQAHLMKWAKEGTHRGGGGPLYTLVSEKESKLSALSHGFEGEEKGREMERRIPRRSSWGAEDYSLEIMKVYKVGTPDLNRRNVLQKGRGEGLFNSVGGFHRPQKQ